MPARFALTIGINYRDLPPGADPEIQARAGLNPLSYAEADAEDLAALLESEGYEVVRLIGASATRARIIQELTKLNRKASAASPSGLLLVHYSGHGAVDSHDGLAFLLPADADPEDLLSTAIPLEDLANRLLGRAQSALVLLDCCHSGYAVGFKGPEAVSKDVETFVSLAGETFERTRRGRITVAACAGEQLARERGDLSHGIFTYYVLEHWRTSTDEVNDASLYEYLALNMPNKGVPPPVRGGSSQQGLIELRSRRALPQQPVKPLVASPQMLADVTSSRRRPGKLSPRVRAELFQLLLKSLSVDSDLRDLAFYAGLAYDKLDGTNLRSNLHSLIAQAEDAGRVRQLRLAIQQFNSYHKHEQQPPALKDAIPDPGEPSSNQVVKKQSGTTEEVDRHVRLGNAYWENQRHAEALIEYNMAVQLDPASIAAHNGLGDVYIAQREYDLALAEFNLAIRLDPNNAYAISGLGDVYGAKGQGDKALAEFNRALELNPNLATAFNGRGNLFLAQERFDEALEEYSRALKLDPNAWYTYIGRGNLYMAQGKYEQALAEFNWVLRVIPQNVYAYCGRGEVYYSLGQYEQALAEFNQAIELQPMFAQAYNGRGNVYSTRQQYEQALAEYNRAIQLDPKNAVFHYNRGDTYYILKRYEQALADFSQAITLNPKLELAYRSRADVYTIQKKDREAAADRKRAAELQG